MRYLLGTICLVALAACDPPVPDSGAGAGVGFSDYATYQARREAQMISQAGDKVPPATAISEETTASAAAPEAAAPRPAGISDEQDFSAVAERETIESDAARIAANREQYQQIAPTALPTRTGGTGASIVDFALNTDNKVGQSLYRRATVFAQDRFRRNCAKFASDDLAQEAFLAAGGPEKDRKGLDPDGDGFACYWDPAPFRQARLAARATPVAAAE